MEKPSSRHVLSSTRIIFKAAKAKRQGNTDTIDKEKVSESAKIRLSVVSYYGKLDEHKHVKYLKKLENYVLTSPSTTTEKNPPSEILVSSTNPSEISPSFFSKKSKEKKEEKEHRHLGIFFHRSSQSNGEENRGHGKAERKQKH
ncbi:uncharacterized protein LOC131876111 [Cryptomeria japonica]|uniref:uncharacterized protein LOC131876111 n=1 Tax=Cryptomeria japonica TaxID=3369 RepID=UPI0027DA4A5B|nr:uncharacterized protein LOC131876111 [Cryptomeria japonica]